MINFGELELQVNEKYSFVGIEKKGSKLVFHIPKGFSPTDITSINTFDSKRDLFFLLYRTLNVFKQTCIEKRHSYSQNSQVLNPGPKYLDDYVKLTGVNIMAVINSYLETEGTEP